MSPFLYLSRDVIYVMYRVPCTVWLPSVTRKGIRSANIDFAALGVNFEGKYYIV